MTADQSVSSVTFAATGGSGNASYAGQTISLKIYIGGEVKKQLQVLLIVTGI